MTTYDARVLKQANFLLSKFGSNTSRVDKGGRFQTFLTRPGCPAFKFCLTELEKQGATQTVFGCSSHQIRTGKKHNNLSKVLALKAFLAKVLGSDPTLDSLAGFIYTYAMVSVKAQEETQDTPETPETQEEVPTVPTPEPPTQPVEVVSLEIDPEAAIKANLAKLQEELDEEW